MRLSELIEGLKVQLEADGDLELFSAYVVNEKDEILTDYSVEDFFDTFTESEMEDGEWDEEHYQEVVHSKRNDDDEDCTECEECEWECKKYDECNCEGECEKCHCEFDEIEECEEI